MPCTGQVAAPNGSYDSIKKFGRIQVFKEATELKGSLD
jgi:hypothetical protein